MSHAAREPWIETPLIESAALSKTAGCRVFLKLELLQPSGSFKSRGIGNLILSAIQNSTKNIDRDGDDNQPPLHFYSSSGGNAGLAAVIAARDLGYPCTVVVPTTTKPHVVQKLRDAGAAAVIQQGRSWAEADEFLRWEFIDNPVSWERSVYVPPFDHEDIWTGVAGMVGEIAWQMPRTDEDNDDDGFPADVIVCSVGGGGLFNGVVEGLDGYLRGRAQAQDDLDSSKRRRKPVRVLAVETSGTHSLAHSLEAGTLQSLPAITSLATSLGALRVSERTLKNAQAPPDGVEVISVVGSDADAARGVVRLADEVRLQVELACGISVEVGSSAAKLKEYVPDLTPESRVVIVVCGGSNISAEMIAEYRERLRDGWC